jgi:Trk-type K+ transport system membrane component
VCIFIFFQTTIFGTCTFPIYDRLRDNRCAFNPSFEHFPNLRYLFDVRRAEQILPFPKHIFYVILLRIFIYFGVTMYFASLPPEEIYDRRGDIICAIAQWAMMIQAVITTERQDRASENPDGTPRQCISVCPWKLAQPIAGYRRSTR